MDDFPQLRVALGLAEFEVRNLLGISPEKFAAYEHRAERPQVSEMQALKGLASTNRTNCSSSDGASNDPEYLRRHDAGHRNTRHQKSPNSDSDSDAWPTFYEFFAGGGMVRAALETRWKCLFANDVDEKKAVAYRSNWGGDELITRDVRKITPNDIPGRADLAWASFPCQDLSIAGMGAGLKGHRSGTFWPFWELVKALRAQDRGPRIIVLENVCGTLTSHNGGDFVAIADALADAGYRFGALVVDAVSFVPQSRPRLFVIAVESACTIPNELLSFDATLLWHPKALQLAQLRLNKKTATSWLWWKLPTPPRRKTRLYDLIEDVPDGVSWHSADATAKLIKMMSKLNREKVLTAKQSGELRVGAVYKRTRLDIDDKKVQRAEIRFDDVAGCLRTSSGGSSRQLVVLVRGECVQSRLLTSREAARLMGLPETYKLPDNYNEAYHLAGDGVVVHVVQYLAQHLLEPILIRSRSRTPHKPTINHRLATGAYCRPSR